MINWHDGPYFYLHPRASRFLLVSPAGRLTTPEGIAKLVAYLVSGPARQITGAAIPIDAGNIPG